MTMCVLQTPTLVRAPCARATYLLCCARSQQIFSALPFSAHQRTFQKAAPPYRRQAKLENLNIGGQDGLTGLNLANKFVIKEIESIMDQYKVAGMGRIYVSEVTILERDVGDYNEQEDGEGEFCMLSLLVVACE